MTKLRMIHRLGPELIFIFLALLGTFPVLSDYEGLVLNELMAVNNSTVPDDQGDYDDWIEIANKGSSPVHLLGLALTDDLANPEAYVFPDVSIGPGEYMLVWADDEPEQGNMHAAFKLTSGGETIYLLHGADILDHTDFPALGNDLSWGRWPDGSGNWKILGEATPGSSNQDPEPPQMALYLNEVMADNYTSMEDPQEAGEFPDWIEIYNHESYTIDLGGLYLTDDLSEPNQYEIPDGVAIPARGFLVFIADSEPDQGPLHTNFKLSSSGDSVYLCQGGYIIDEVTFGTLGRDRSWGRYPDGTGSWKNLGVATPGSPNQDPDLPELYLFINEFMADNSGTIEDPDEPGQYPDWIELYNAESTALDLSGMYLSDEADQPTKFPIPQGVSIPPHAYLVFWADDERDQGPLHLNFKLGQGGEMIQLYQSDGETLVDYVEFGAQQTDISFGRYPDGTDNWGYHSHPTPGAANLPETSSGLTLRMDDRELKTGDRFDLYFTLWPDTATYNTDVYIILDIHGMYWSWPDWKSIPNGIGWKSYAVYPGNQLNETVLDFDWPVVEGSGSGLYFYGAAMRKGTYDLIGDLQVIEFGYE